MSMHGARRRQRRDVSCPCAGRQPRRSAAPAEAVGSASRGGQRLATRACRGAGEGLVLYGAPPRREHMTRAHNFHAGPAGLPLPALERAARELIDFEGTGMSIMEHSHRGKSYEAVHDEALRLLRELLAIPDEYDVIFLQGGASQQ